MSSKSAGKNITFRLQTVEDDGREIYLTGDFNNWNPRDPDYVLQRMAEGRYKIDVPKDSLHGDPVKYKYVKGGWGNEEVNSVGLNAENRVLKAGVRSVTDKAYRFKNNGVLSAHPFFPKTVIHRDFHMPELGKRRTIRVLLPYNYHTGMKRYNVLYLNDGQNLWDKEAPFGHWGLDQHVANMASNGKNDVIYVGIDHGGTERINEFTPIHGTTLGRGDGRKYMKFLVETLKPFIDKTYRTITDRWHTGIGGSSMGGLISIYAGLMYPETFGKLMIFSPSLWVTQNVYYESIRFFSPSHTMIYLYAGGKESHSMIPAIKRFKENLESSDISESLLEVKLSLDPTGTHTEARWGREFIPAVQWLFYRKRRVRKKNEEAG